jgi:hypothetical protein
VRSVEPFNSGAIRKRLVRAIIPLDGGRSPDHSRGSHRVSRALFGVSPKSSRITHLPRRSPAKAVHASPFTFSAFQRFTFSLAREVLIRYFTGPQKTLANSSA